MCGITSLSQDSASLQRLFPYLLPGAQSEDAGTCDQRWGCSHSLLRTEDEAEGWQGVEAGRGLCPQHEHISSGDRKNDLGNPLAGKCLYYQVLSREISWYRALSQCRQGEDRTSSWQSQWYLLALSINDT